MVLCESCRFNQQVNQSQTETGVMLTFQPNKLGSKEAACLMKTVYFYSSQPLQ